MAGRPYPQRGYWGDCRNPSLFHSCADEGCSGGSAFSCGASTVGPFCAKCAPDHFTLGGNCHRCPGHGMRSALSTPVGGLFFAGEATQEDINPCVQGAMETGMRAAAQVRQRRQQRER